jgi:hypothetical protein
VAVLPARFAQDDPFQLPRAAHVLVVVDIETTIEEGNEGTDDDQLDGEAAGG